MSQYLISKSHEIGSSTSDFRPMTIRKSKPKTVPNHAQSKIPKRTFFGQQTPPFFTAMTRVCGCSFERRFDCVAVWLLQAAKFSAPSEGASEDECFESKASDTKE